MIFAGLAILSGVLSNGFIASFLGNKGWFVGSFVIVTASLFSIFIGRAELNHKLIIRFIETVNIFFFVIAILHSLSIDVFMIHERIVAHQYFMYLSTIGNVNWFSGYMCLVFPLVLYDYINDRNILNSITISLALMNILLLNCDSIFLCLGLMSIVAIPYTFRNRCRIKRTSEITFIFGICCIFLHLFNDKMNLTTGIIKTVVNPFMIILIIVVSLFFRYLSTKDSHKLYRITMIAIEILIILCFLYFAWSLYGAVKTYNYY